jgi:hypothetical protein
MLSRRSRQLDLHLPGTDVNDTQRRHQENGRLPVTERLICDRHAVDVATAPARSGWRARTWAVSFLELSDEDPHATQRAADRPSPPVEPEEQHGFAAKERLGDECGELLGREGAERAEIALRLPGDFSEDSR